MVAIEAQIGTAPNPDLTSVENAIYQKLLVNDLLRILASPEFFGGPKHGNDKLTTEIAAYTNYCETIQTQEELFTVEAGLPFPQSRRTGSAKDTHLIAWGLAIPENFNHLLVENPGFQLYNLVTAALESREKIVENPADKTTCLNQFTHAVERLKGDFGSLEGFLQKEIGIQMPENFDVMTPTGQLVML